MTWHAFESHAVPIITGEIRRHLREQVLADAVWLPARHDKPAARRIALPEPGGTL
ncbi:hypothetical protein [Streptomyces sp. NPDC021622]|uniref:hypothetical protein n=1 Tax=Streptomyces sp. NPDC021622 TaxID=3155013 RepID=UPI0033E99258